MPKVLESGPYVLFFWSAENGGPVHVHAAARRPAENATKIWLTRSGGCILANNNSGILDRDLRNIPELVSDNHDCICDLWRSRFQGDINFL